MSARDLSIVEKMLGEVRIVAIMMAGADLESFLEDEKLKRAVCMTVINVGELTKGLSDEFRSEHRDVPWKAIAGFRDVAAHKYQTLRMEDVYATVSDDFPDLEQKLEQMLQKAEGEIEACCEGSAVHEEELA